MIGLVFSHPLLCAVVVTVLGFAVAALALSGSSWGDL